MFKGIWLMLLGFAAGLFTDRFQEAEDQEQYTTHYFDNFADHFEKPFTGRKFKQRYYLVENYWKKKNPTVAMLHICSEAPCSFPNNRLFPRDIARDNDGLLFVLEHRFYGTSQPTPDFSLKSLQLLTHDQSLADYAYFMESLTQLYQEKYKITLKWLIAGGSYSGALTAWFQLKYPHITVGALSSSGVVTALNDFWTFERQVVEDLREDGPDCLSIVKYYHEYAEECTTKGNNEKRKNFIKIFTDNPNVTNEEFWFYFVDISVELPQYSHGREFCQYVKALNESGAPIDDQLRKYKEFASKSGVKFDDYSYKILQDETLSNLTNARQWTYQYCTSFGWFQTPYAENPLRWKGMDLAFWLRFCRGAFGETLVPRTDHTNAIYGAEEVARRGSHIIFTNGRNDPWKWVSIQENFANNSNIEVLINDCVDCGHCRELYTAKDDDPAEVKSVRKKVQDIFKRWISESTQTFH